MRHFTIGFSVILLALTWSVSAAEITTRLEEIPLDTVWLNGGTPMHGIINEIRADGTVVITIDATNEKDGKVVTLPKSRYERIVRRISAADSLKKNSEGLLAARDWDAILKAVKWGMDRESAKAEALTLASKAVTLNPAQVALAEIVLANLGDKGDPQQVEDLVRKVLGADSHWRNGRKHLVKLLTDGNRNEELLVALNEWLVVAPTDPDPCTQMAEIKESAGDLKGAISLRRRIWESQHAGPAGVAYAFILLRCGEFQKAIDVSAQLADQEATARPAKAIAGSAKLFLGKTEEAEPLLKAATDGELPEAMVTMAKYNLALSQHRLGRDEDARALWSALDHPMARYALAVLDRQAFTEIEKLTPLAPQVLIHNALLATERNPASVLPDDIQTIPGRQAQLLQAVVKACKAGTVEAARSLNIFPGPVSLRWQAYVHLTGKRWDDALAVLDQLPADDGYALAYRFFIALEKKDAARVNELWAQLQTSRNPPREWVARMSLVMQANSSENIQERFDLEGVVPPSGWVYSTPGTGITLQQHGGCLWFEGKQRKSGDEVSRAFRPVKQERLRRVVAVMDLTRATSAIVGIEILEAPQRRSGIALGVQLDRSLAWRERRNGVWSEWKSTSMKVGEGKVTVALEYTSGQVKTFMVDTPDKFEKLGDWDGRSNSELYVSVFGTAEEGQEWKAGVEDVRIELNDKTSTLDKNL